eukprot:2793065-Pleurochrysis_carterae.AAC.1
MSRRLAVRWPSDADSCEYSSSVCAFGALLLATNSRVSSCTASPASCRFVVAIVLEVWRLHHRRPPRAS